MVGFRGLTFKSTGGGPSPFSQAYRVPQLRDLLAKPDHLLNFVTTGLQTWRDRPPGNPKPGQPPRDAFAPVSDKAAPAAIEYDWLRRLWRKSIARRPPRLWITRGGGHATTGAQS